MKVGMRQIFLSPEIDWSSTGKPHHSPVVTLARTETASAAPLRRALVRVPTVYPARAARGLSAALRCPCAAPSRTAPPPIRLLRYVLAGWSEGASMPVE